MIRAIAHRIVVKPDEVMKKSKGGILIATDERMEQHAMSSGTILSIGEDAWAAYKPRTAYAGLEVGDRVHYARYAGKWVKDSETEEEVLVLNDEDIVAKEIIKEPK
jgi:co-chaperonin GroES (HSP10)